MKILVIQTAFIGDVILATPVLEKLHQFYPKASIDMLVRKGNESLLSGHPFLQEVLIFDKRQDKYANLFKLIQTIRQRSYDYVINLQRFFSSGLLTIASGAPHRIGFDKNPLSVFFSQRFPHEIGQNQSGLHEVDRNLSLIQHLTDEQPVRPKLYPSEADWAQAKTEGPYCCIAPASIWYTKQFPKKRWIELINHLPQNHAIYLIGGPADQALCEEIVVAALHPQVINKAGQLSLLASAALIKGAMMNYVNDSAPLHLASAVNAPVTAIFCSTVPQFGFGPLSERAFIAETDHQLSCRPCGLHGKRVCPEGHFRCSDISIDQLLWPFDLKTTS